MECRLNPRAAGSFLSSCHPRDVHFITTPRTWHPHIYDPPPKQPTPFLISHILGLSDQSKNRGEGKKLTKDCDSSPDSQEQTLRKSHYSTGGESFKDECKCGGCLSGLKENDNQQKSGSPVTSKDFNRTPEDINVPISHYQSCTISFKKNNPETIYSDIWYIYQLFFLVWRDFEKCLL